MATNGRKAKRAAAPVSHTVFLRDADLGCEVILASGDSVAYPAHSHMTSCVVGIVRAGRMRFSLDGRSEDVRAGGMFVIPPHRVHTLSASAPYAMLNFCFDNPDTIRSRAAAVGKALRRLVRRGVISGEECAALECAVRRVASDGRRTETRKAEDRLDALRREIVADPGRYPDLERMAGAVHLCPRHFARVFRTRYGLPPRRYQNQSRLRNARRGMASGGHSLVEAALGAGFCDQSHFIREFKKLYRMTPRQYLLSSGALPQG